MSLLDHSRGQLASECHTAVKGRVTPRARLFCADGSVTILEEVSKGVRKPRSRPPRICRKRGIEGNRGGGGGGTVRDAGELLKRGNPRCSASYRGRIRVSTERRTPGASLVGLGLRLEASADRHVVRAP